MNSLPSLYESDFNLWLETHAHLLKQKQFAQMDLEHLIEIFPDDCPFTPEQVLNPDYLPD